MLALRFTTPEAHSLRTGFAPYQVCCCMHMHMLECVLLQANVWRSMHVRTHAWAHSHACIKSKEDQCRKGAITFMYACKHSDAGMCGRMRRLTDNIAPTRLTHASTMPLSPDHCERQAAASHTGALVMCTNVVMQGQSNRQPAEPHGSTVAICTHTRQRQLPDSTEGVSVPRTVATMWNEYCVSTTSAVPK